MPIHKVELSGRTVSKVEMQIGSKILRTGIQNRDGKTIAVVWFNAPSVDRDTPAKTVRIASIPTGSDAPNDAIYIGTTQVQNEDGSENVHHHFVDHKSAGLVVDATGTFAVVR